jgi:hypothetical protein
LDISLSYRFLRIYRSDSISDSISQFYLLYIKAVTFIQGYLAVLYLEQSIFVRELVALSKKKTTEMTTSIH